MRDLVGVRADRLALMRSTLGPAHGTAVTFERPYWTDPTGDADAEDRADEDQARG
jgi:hypothetical protein